MSGDSQGMVFFSWSVIHFMQVSPGHSFFSRQRNIGVGHMSQHFEDVTFFGVDDLLHFSELFLAEAFFRQTVQEPASGVWEAPDASQFVLVLDEFRLSPEERLHELCGRHGRSARVPEARGDHVLDGALLAVVQTRAASDDLLEFNHGIDGPHEHDVADVAGIHAGGQFLRGGQNRGDGL